MVMKVRRVTAREGTVAKLRHIMLVERFHVMIISRVLTVNLRVVYWLTRKEIICMGELM